MYLETVTGKFINVANPLPEQIDIHDIAWGLSRMPRFAGQTITKQPYTVAQHSVLVANLVRKLNLTINSDTIMMALLHDAAEAYIGDIPSPVKKHPLIRDILKEFEYNLLSRIYARFDLPKITEEQKAIIKAADMKALAIEAHAFMVSRGNSDYWGNLPDVDLLERQNFEEPWNSTKAYQTFLNEYNLLKYIRKEER